MTCFKTHKVYQRSLATFRLEKYLVLQDMSPRLGPVQLNLVEMDHLFANSVIEQKIRE